MAFRLLRYQDRIWERWRADHLKVRTLPMIIPIVMYHGVTPWSEPRAFDALLDVPPGLRPAVEPYLVRFTYLLHDLSEIALAIEADRTPLISSDLPTKLDHRPRMDRTYHRLRHSGSYAPSAA
jgi:hypothetical protein